MRMRLCVLLRCILGLVVTVVLTGCVAMSSMWSKLGSVDDLCESKTEIDEIFCFRLPPRQVRFQGKWRPIQSSFNWNTRSGASSDRLVLGMATRSDKYNVDHRHVDTYVDDRLIARHV